MAGTCWVQRIVKWIILHRVLPVEFNDREVSSAREWLEVGRMVPRRRSCCARAWTPTRFGHGSDTYR